MEVGVQAIIPMSDRTVKNVGVPALVHFCLDDLAPVGLRATVPIGSAPPRRLRTSTTLRDASRPPRVPVDIRERTRSIGSSVPRLSGDDIARPLRRPGVWVWRYGCRNQSTEPKSGDSWSHGAQPSSWRFSPSRNIARTIYRARSVCLSAAWRSRLAAGSIRTVRWWSTAWIRPETWAPAPRGGSSASALPRSTTTRRGKRDWLAPGLRRKAPTPSAPGPAAWRPPTSRRARSPTGWPTSAIGSARLLGCLGRRQRVAARQGAQAAPDLRIEQAMLPRAEHAAAVPLDRGDRAVPGRTRPGGPRRSPRHKGSWSVYCAARPSSGWSPTSSPINRMGPTTERNRHPSGPHRLRGRARCGRIQGGVSRRKSSAYRRRCVGGGTKSTSGSRTHPISPAWSTGQSSRCS